MIELSFTHLLALLVSVLIAVIGYVNSRITRLEKRSDETLSKVQTQVNAVSIVADKSPTDREVNKLVDEKLGVLKNDLKEDISNLGQKMDSLQAAVMNVLIETKKND